MTECSPHCRELVRQANSNKMGKDALFLFQREMDANLSDERDLKNVYDEVEARMRYRGLIIREFEQMSVNRRS